MRSDDLIPLQYTTVEPPPEERIAKMLKDDLGVTVNAQALRMFIRTRWARLSKAAHEVHDA
jgi:hypothetical protein